MKKFHEKVASLIQNVSKCYVIYKYDDICV